MVPQQRAELTDVSAHQMTAHADDAGYYWTCTCGDRGEPRSPWGLSADFRVHVEYLRARSRHPAGRGLL